MKTPFTIEQFFSVFESYNSAVFPAQLILLLLGIFALYMVITQKTKMDRTVGSLFGLVIYPVISFFPGGTVEKTISFGLPCPTTIATFGFFLLTGKKFPKYLVIIPSLWALIGTTAALKFGVYQDFLLIVTAIVANIYLLRKKRHKNVSTLDRDNRKPVFATSGFLCPI